MAPRTLSHYDIISQIGVGGMGEVFLAHDTRLDRRVALKVLPDAVSKNLERRQRFVAEAKAAAALNHPHVCTIYEVGQTDETQLFIAMEYVEGATLDKQPLPALSQFVEIALQAADALRAAHELGIIHRDIKPGNLCLNQSHQVKVLDFGLAKRLTEIDHVDPEEETLYQTKEGRILGTPSYMSPEQAMGLEADQRSDLFSLGVVLYEWLTGQRPFEGKDRAETLERILGHAPVPVSSLKASVPGELERIIMKCLQKKADDRFQSVSELIVDLRQFHQAIRSGSDVSRTTAIGEVATLLQVQESLRGKGESSEADQEASARSFLAYVQELIKGYSSAVPVRSFESGALVALGKPTEALQFALALNSRMPCQFGIHLGQVVDAGAEKADERFVLHFKICAALAQAAEGGGILMSRAVFDSARLILDESIHWVNHGAYALKGLEEPIEICEVVEPGRSGGPPKETEDLQRRAASNEELVLGWRPAVGQFVPRTRWRLVENLGEGGFGEIWRGSHETLKEERVFKFCFRADRVRTLKRELTLFRLLRERVGHHPGIVGIQDVNLEEAPYYLMMEFTKACDLKEWCRRQGGIQRVSEAQKLEIVAQLGEALQVAHDAGVIHRDIKPDNILVEEDLAMSGGIRVRLTDFGIGQVVSNELLAGVSATGFTDTKVGSNSGAGTHIYMAPELLAGEDASPRSDIYSMGVVLYQLLVGDFRRSISGDWATSIGDPLMKQDLDLCFAWSPQERFAGAVQLARLLRQLDERRAALAEEARKIEKERAIAYRNGLIRAFAMAAVVVLSFILLALFGWEQAERAKSEARRAEARSLDAQKNLYAADMVVARDALQRGNFGRTQDILSPYIATGEGEVDLRSWEWRYLWNQCKGDELSVLPLEGAAILKASYSPDGEQIAVVNLFGELKLVDAHTHEVLAEAKFPTVYDFEYGPDGTLCFLTHEKVLFLDAHSLEERLPSIEMDSKPQYVRFLRGGDEIAVLTRGSLRFYDCESRRLIRKVLVPSARALAVSPDEGTVAVGLMDGHVYLWDVATKRMSRMLGGMKYYHTSQTAMAFSNDGRYLVSTAGVTIRDVTIWDLTVSNEPIKVLSFPSWVFDATFSPDGRFLTLARADQKISFYDVGTWELAGSLVGHESEVWSLSYSPDGDYLITGSKDETLRVWEPEPKSELDYQFFPLDGKKAAVLSGGGSRLVTLDDDSVVSVIETSDFRELIQRKMPELRAPRVWTSYDGELIAVQSEEGPLSILEAGTLRDVQQLGTGTTLYKVQISRDNRWVLAIDSLNVAWWFDLSGKAEPKRRVLKEATGISSAQISPDNRVAVIAIARPENEINLYDTMTWEKMATLGTHSQGVSDLAIYNDGRLLISTSMDGTSKIWDLERQRLKTVLRGGLNIMRGLSLSVDESRIMIGSTTDLLLIDTPSLREVLRLTVAEETPRGILQTAYSESDHSILARIPEGIARWSVPTLEEIDQGIGAE